LPTPTNETVIREIELDHEPAASRAPDIYHV